jgi:hypothetical protein
MGRPNVMGPTRGRMDRMSQSIDELRNNGTVPVYLLQRTMDLGRRGRRRVVK